MNTMGVVRDMAVQGILTTSRKICQYRLAGSPAKRDLSRPAVVSSFSHVNGISRGAQLQHDALDRAGYSPQRIDVSTSVRELVRRVPHESASAYIFHVAGPQMATMISGVLPDASSAWRIGYWAWELAEPPAGWEGCDGLVDEIWTPSTFSAKALAQIVSVPIRVVPHRVPLQAARCRNYNGPFTVLTLADSRSSFSRKNPIGAVAAFRQAFGQRPDTRLIIKLNGRDHEMAALTSAIGPASNIEIVKGLLSESQMADLFRSADVLLSMHRAEGFGLPMLEAMAHGVPVVGTGWSGNVDFMDDVDSFLIPYETTPVHDSAGVYGNSYMWAEPNVDAATEFLLKLCRDRAVYERKACSAHEKARALSENKIVNDIQQ